MLTITLLNLRDSLRGKFLEVHDEHSLWLFVRFSHSIKVFFLMNFVKKSWKTGCNKHFENDFNAPEKSTKTNLLENIVQ